MLKRFFLFLRLVVIACISYAIALETFILFSSDDQAVYDTTSKSPGTNESE